MPTPHVDVPLNDDMIRPVAFVIGNIEGPEKGSVVRGAAGTACFAVVRNEADPQQFHAYVVTAAHVVIGQRRTEIRLRDDHGNVLPDRPISGWVVHEKSDIAAAPTAFDSDVVINPFVRDMGIDRREGPLRLAEPVFFMGLLAGFDKMERSAVPMVRSGTVGAYYQRDVPLPAGRFDEAHLIDCRSFQGFSRSPCVIQRTSYAYVERS